jgi:phosphatidylserine/phosphatidylglycerophosphate/cardiolipin synthase-like enzyme
LRRITVLVVAVLMTCALTAESAAAYEPSGGAVFNNPFGNHSARARILVHVLQAVDHAPKGSTIRFAVYSFDRRSFANALVRAHRRGVNVQMVLNDNWTSQPTKRLRKVLGHNPKKKSFVVICVRSCRGGYGNQHMKIYLFTKSGKATHVIMTGSANLTTFGAVNQWNDLYTILRAPKMFKLYTGIFFQLKRDKRVKHPFVSATTGRYQSSFYPHPHTTRKNDPLMRRLEKIRCHAVGHTGKRGHSKIRIEVYGWQNSRGKYLAHKVASMRRRGCNIKVILSDGGGVVASRLKKAHIPVRSADYDYNKNGSLEKFTHEKMMTLSGTYGGKGAHTVWTGSENWSNLASHNDEVTLRIDKTRAYTQYLRSFNYVWRHHSHAISKHYGEHN